MNPNDLRQQLWAMDPRVYEFVDWWVELTYGTGSIADYAKALRPLRAATTDNELMQLYARYILETAK